MKAKVITRGTERNTHTICSSEKHHRNTKTGNTEELEGK